MVSKTSAFRPDEKKKRITQPVPSGVDPVKASAVAHAAIAEAAPYLRQSMPVVVSAAPAGAQLALVDTLLRLEAWKADQPNKEALPHLSALWAVYGLPFYGPMAPQVRELVIEVTAAASAAARELTDEGIPTVWALDAGAGQLRLAPEDGPICEFAVYELVPMVGSAGWRALVPDLVRKVRENVALAVTANVPPAVTVDLPND